MELSDWTLIRTHILQLEQEGLVTRTFRRLDLERQQAITLAILEEAIDKGPAALNIKEVARRAQVSVGSLYTYFENRDTLLDFAVELCARYIVDEFDRYRPMLAAMPLQDALAAYLVGGVTWGQTQVNLLRFFARAAYHGDPNLLERLVRPVGLKLREMVQDIFQAAAERGEIREDIDIATTARLVNALMIAVGDSQLLPYLNTYFQVFDDGISPEQSLPVLIDLIIGGVGHK